jgi:hypothetical protein
MSEVAKSIGQLFPQYNLCINLNKTGLGHIFGTFFHKLIWSPRSQRFNDKIT